MFLIDQQSIFIKDRLNRTFLGEPEVQLFPQLCLPQLLSLPQQV